MLIKTSLYSHYKISILFAIICILFYFSFAYHLVRTDYLKLISLYSALFFLFYKMLQMLKGNMVLLTWFAFIFRAVFIFSVPNLSQDIYRFIWDGRLIVEGLNPYLHTVASFIGKGEFPIEQAQVLYIGMGELNASHFSNYPPLNQWCFALAALLGDKSILGSVIVMRMLIIAADFGTLYFGKKLLEKLEIPIHNIFLYILNPFIIIELTGNLHFEGVMIFFLVWSLYLLYCDKWKLAAIILGLSISVKLIPLIFLPLFYQWFIKKKDPKKNGVSVFSGITKLITFYSIIFLTVLVTFVPFYSEQVFSNYIKTTGLWFQEFEFNASLYYIARAIGYSFRGYNEIVVIGKAIAIMVFIFVLALALFRRNRTTLQLIAAMLFALSFYYFTTTTVHPWYIATLLILSVFTNYKFPLIWSFVIILSYLAYLNVNSMDKSENLWVVGLEYLIVFSFFIWEVCIKKATEKVA